MAVTTHFYPGSGIMSGFTSCGTRGSVTADPELVTCQACIAAEKARGIPWPLTHGEYVAARRGRERGWAGEHGPELVRFRGDETVISSGTHGGGR